MVSQKFKLKLTIEERILSHIRDYSKYEHNLQAPFALTQDGIAKAVSVVRSAIPRSMKKLADKGFVKEQIGHVEGVTRRRKIYYLTTDGLLRAQEIHEKVERITCLARNQEGRESEMRVSEVNKFLGTNFSLLEVLEGLSEDGTFDYQTYIAKKSGAVSTEDDSEILYSLIDKAPKLSFFTGREDELATLKEWLDGDTYRIVVVHGIAGIGKTTLALKLIDEYLSNKHIVWYRFHQWDTLRYFVKTLGTFLAGLGRRDLQRYIESEPVLDLNNVGEILEASFKDLNALIIVDDFHKAREDILPIFTFFVELLERLSGPKVLIFTRNIVPFYDRRHVRVKKLVGELRLEGLTKPAAKELLEHRGLAGAEVDPIYNLTAGHPLSLELVDADAEKKDGLATDDLNIYIQEEIFSRLPEKERDVLSYASVYRYGVPKDMLLEIADGGFETLKDLTSRALLEHASGIYNVHDLIREFFYETQSASARKNYHKQAADFYLKRIESIEKELGADEASSMIQLKDPDKPSNGGLAEVLTDSACEGLYHLIKSEQFEAAGELSAAYGERLLEFDLYEELLELLSIIPGDRLSGLPRAVVHLILGEIYNHYRDFEGARNYYNESLETFRMIRGEASEPKRMALIYKRLGFIHERQDDWEQARKHHEKSLELAEKASDAFAISDANGALGWLYWNRGDHERANDYYNKCIGMADKITDMPGKAKIYLGICMALAKRGELEDALVYYEKCLEVLERNEDIFKLARSYEGIGDHYLQSIFTQFLKSSKQR